jgi:hypothetical protein
MRNPQVSKHVIAAPGADPKAARLWLTVLNHLRGVQLDALLEGRPAAAPSSNQSRRGRGNSSGGNSGGSAAAAAAAVTEDPASWSKVCRMLKSLVCEADNWHFIAGPILAVHFSGHLQWPAIPI